MTTLGVVPPNWFSELDNWANGPAWVGAATSNTANKVTNPGNRNFFMVFLRLLETMASQPATGAA